MIPTIHVPEELIQLIFSHLELHGDPTIFDCSKDRRTLAALCKVNRQCHRLATPFLYQSVYPSINESSINKLVRTLLSRPELARYITTVWMIESQVEEEHMPDDLDDDEYDVTDSDFYLYMETLAPLHLINDQDRLFDSALNGLCRGQESANLVLLLTIAQNINTIHMEVPWGGGVLMVPQLLSYLSTLAGLDIASSNRILPKLETLELSWSDTEGALSLCEMRMFPRIPTLKTLRGHMVDISFTEMEEVDFGQEQCNLREIQLDWSIADADGIRLLLSCCPLLEKLSIEWGSAVVGGEYEIRWDEIGKALREFGRSLKIVKFDTTEAFYYELEDITSHPRLGDVRELAALEKLTVPVIALLGHEDPTADDFETFPDTLKYLEISQAGGYLVDEIENLLGKIMTSTTLQKLRIYGLDFFLEGFERSQWQKKQSHQYEVVFERI